MSFAQSKISEQQSEVKATESEIRVNNDLDGLSLASFDQHNGLKNSLVYLQGSIIDNKFQSLMGSLAAQQVPEQFYMQEVNVGEYEDDLPIIED